MEYGIHRHLLLEGVITIYKNENECEYKRGGCCKYHMRQGRKIVTKKTVLEKSKIIFGKVASVITD